MKTNLVSLFAISILFSIIPSVPGLSQQRNRDQRTATQRDTSTLRIDKVSDRTTFIRMESNVVMKFKVTNVTSAPLDNVVLSVAFDWAELNKMKEFVDSARLIKINSLAGGESREVPVYINTRIRPDLYRILMQFSIAGQDSLKTGGEFPVRIVARKPPKEYPVVMWGNGTIEELKRIGFTHSLGLGANLGKIWEAVKPVAPDSEERIRQTRLQLDEALAAGITMASSLAPGSYLRRNEKYLEVDRDGKPYKGGGESDICGLFPEIGEFCYNVGVSMAKAYGDMPAYGASLLHSEVRDASNPCFHKFDCDAFKKASGMNIPKEIGRGKSMDYKTLKKFPKDRVVSDKDPILTYYRWWWKDGDGWNNLHTQLNNGLKTMNRPEFWTWFDPAVRAASVYGSGGAADVISQWTYTYPDPIRIGLATDELLTMASGAAQKQDVMSMTQIIWYRSRTAPIRKANKPGPEYVADWEKGLTQDRELWPTIAPMHLREALWTKIARPIKGIMYHGWQSLVKVRPSGYVYTNPETQYELQRLTTEVIKPLGPTLLTVPGIKSDIAYYESFAAQVFARRGTSGWGGSWLGDAYYVMLWAGLQPDIVYDETINEKGLDNFKILVMADCDVITASVLEKVKAFQKRGGIIIADTSLTPALKADIMIEKYRRTGQGLNDKTALLARAEQLSKDLNNKGYVRYLESSNSQVIPYRRRFAETDYIFLVNDYREYGKYMGQHGLVMENGLPSEARIFVNRKSGFVYDLVAHQPVKFHQEVDRMVTDIKLGPCDGRMFMVTPVEIDHINIIAPDKTMRGDQKNVGIEVVDLQGKSIEAVIPLEVQIQDAEGRLAENSGYYAAVNGKLNIVLDIAPNDYEGIWQIFVRELASSKTEAIHFRVGKKPSGKTGPLDENAGDAKPPRG